MNQQNNNNQIKLPRRSRRLATIIPAAHWISMGYSEDDAQLMEELQNDMKKYCDSSGDVDIDFNGRNDIGVLPHHDLMLPHWKKLAKALNGRTSVQNAYITGISLPTSVLDIVFPALQLVNIVELTLFGTGLGDEGFQCLSSFLGNNSSLTSLGVGADQLDDLFIASALSDAIKNHPTLEEVFIGDCSFPNDPAFEKILEGCTARKRLTLTLENFDADDVIAISDFIRSNHPIEKLHLRDYNITDNDTKLMALALKTNTHLKEMDLRENDDITEEGEKALLKAMFDPTCMDSIVDSNHVCKAYAADKYEFYFSITAWLDTQQPTLPFGLEREVIYINGLDISVGQKIRKKVVLALCGFDGGLFNLSHFNVLPLGVMTRVLELIQEHSLTRAKLEESKEHPWFDTTVVNNSSTPKQLEKDALSRLFHTLRGWELPSLFVNLNTPSANVATGKRKRRKTRR